MNESLNMLLRELRLPGFANCAQQVAISAQREGSSFLEFLHQLSEFEINDRKRKKLERYLRQSNIPKTKCLETLNLELFSEKVKSQIGTLCRGDFVKEAHNVLAFGLPGRGKTHLLCAIGLKLIAQGYRVLFTPTYALVQKLLKSKRDLKLDKELKRLDSFDAIILDDIGYVQQDRDEMEVLFTFFAERYERKSVLISSNLVFSQWDKIFKDKMTTAAAVDRLVHHSVILELTGPSYRTQSAMEEIALDRKEEKAPIQAQASC